MELKSLHEPLRPIAEEASELILERYRSGNFKTEDKSDDTPVTSADKEASEFITRKLKQLTPDIPVLSEEAIVPWPERRQWERYWLVDPLDGTQEFINGSGDFAVVIAYVERHQPVFGMINWPTEQALYWASRGHGAWRQYQGRTEKLQVRQLQQPQSDPLTIAVSRRQPEERVLSRIHSSREVNIVHTGSCALKSCLVAEGNADVFMRVGPTGEWDTGAAQILVEEAGGQLLGHDFRPITYNMTPSVENPDFIVLGDPRVDWISVFR